MRHAVPVLAFMSSVFTPFLPAMLHAEPLAELRAPSGGWHYDGLIEPENDARVAYPTPPIDRGAQRHRTLIEGRLTALKDERKPHTLAVNGNPLPLYTDGEGRFARPYAFGAGSNSIALLSADGGDRRKVQFYEANMLKTPARIRVVLGWDDPRAEIDLHLVTPDGQHAYWADPVMNNGGGLDVDGVDGPGPEMFTMAEPVRGAYLIFVNYWGNLGVEGYSFNDTGNQNEIVTTRISLVFNENTLNEKRETFVIPLRAIGDLMLVKSFRY
ncbi:MAG: YfaP family protein [Methylococcales bacterium]